MVPLWRTIKSRNTGWTATAAASLTSSTEHGRGRPAADIFTPSDPPTAEKLASVAQGSAADVGSAVQSARVASPKWRALTPHARARYLYALARLVQKHSRLLAVLETMDNGKCIRESRYIDIPLVARHFYHHAGWA